jgi:hypothetical protein
MRLLAHSDLGGFGNGGEGIGLHASKGRRTLFIAHESAPVNFTGVDVSDPRRPMIICQTRLPHAAVRSNALALRGDLLAVAYQTNEPGQTPAGMELFDISEPRAPRSIGFFDTSGPHSHGAHYVNLDAEGFAYLATGMPAWEPKRPIDHQLLVIVDVRDPTAPREVGRYWLPGQRKGEPDELRFAPAPDGGPYRAHNVNVHPERPDRAYVAYCDGGVLILDISDRARPALVSRFDYHPPMKYGFTHTVVPLVGRGLVIVSDEANSNRLDLPKLVWVMDARHERQLVPLSTLPLPPYEEFRGRGGRFGAHNIHENDPVPTAFRSEELVFGAFFNAGIRVYDIRDQFRPEEIGFYIPPAPAGSPLGATQLNDVYVDENRVIYGLERVSGGLYILELTR